MNKFLQERFLRRIKDFYQKNRKMSIGIVVMALLCFSAVTVYALMPKVSAAPGSLDNPNVIRTAETTVDPGGYYAIQGNSSSTYKLSYSGDNTTEPAYIILDGVNFTLNSDIPAIEFTGAGINDGTSSYDANFVVYIKGENSIVSNYSGAKEPLIKAEMMTYDVKSYDKDSQYVADEQKFKSYTVNRNNKVRFTGMGSAEDELRLVTASGSTGAAIGSAEMSQMGSKIAFKAGVGQYYIVIDGVTYKHGQEVFTGNLKCGNGDITISDNANIIIEGKGSGAGIGSGASLGSVVRFKGTSSVGAVNVQTANAKDIMRRDGVNITGGTLAVTMDSNSLGSCIGTGAIEQERYNEGSVVITGGSVAVNPSVMDGEFAKAFNGNGEQIYKFILDVGEWIGTDGVIRDGETFALQDTVGGERVYIVRYAGSDAGTDSRFNFTVDNSSGPSYTYNGYAKKYFDYSNESKLYFYLPTEKLTPYIFTLNGDLGSVTYQYSIGEDVFTNILAGYGISMKETKDVTIKLNNVPEFCTNVSFRTSSNAAGTITKNENDEYLYSFKMPSEDFSIDFSYDIGTYNINYDYGMVGDSVINNNPTSYVCGETYTLDDITAEGVTFMGWYSDAALTQEVSNITSSVVGDTVTVYAKWACAVTFQDDQGNTIYETLVDLGNRFTESDYPENPQDTIDKVFEGWKINGVDYAIDEYHEFVVSENTVITGNYKEVGYYVYVNGSYTDEFGYTTVADIQRMCTLNMFFQGNPISFTESVVDEKFSYKTVGFADRSDITTGNITAKSGYKVSEITVADAEGNPLELFTSLDENNSFAFTMPNMDIYITVHFEAPDYSITYYDYNVENSEFVIVEPVSTADNETVYVFNARTETFKLNPAPQTNKYKRFAGWYVFGDATKTIIEEIPMGQYSSDIVLIATWEDVVTYPITVDESVAEYVKVYDEDGTQVSMGIPGERLTIKVEPGPGIRYDSMTYSYMDADGGIYTNKKIPSVDSGNTGTYTMVMPMYAVDVTGEFSVITYNITYLSLEGAQNDNPTTYTVRDIFELADPVRGGYVFKGWTIVLPDPENGYAGVKEEAITRIENQTGNIILVAHWEADENYLPEPSQRLHKVTVGSGISNGSVTTYVEEAYETQYVFVKITPERGYKLKSLTYQMETPVLYSAVRSLRAIESTFDISFDITLFEVAEGIYYFIMPDSDIDLVAEFEPIEYTITYLDGTSNLNPEVYTVEDVITLTDAEKIGYEFLGWYSDEDEKIEKIENFVGNITLTAKWKQANTEPGEDTEPNPDEPETDQTGTDRKPDTKPEDNGNSFNTDSIIEQIISIIKDKSQFGSTEDTASQGNSNSNSTGSNSNRVSGSQITTGDTANISHLLLLCIASLIIIVIAVPKKRDDELN